MRLVDWFAHMGLASEPHNYIGASANSARTIVSQIPQVIEAEIDLRALSTRLAGRTVIISREASPFSSGRIEESLLQLAGHSVYDFDDALYADTTSLATRIWPRKARWMRAVRAADVVIAGSAILADAACEYSDRVIVVPSCVEPHDYVVKSDHTLGEVPRAVWIGSPSTEQFLTGISDALLVLHKKFGLRLTVISGGNQSLGPLSSIVDRVQWSRETFGSELAHADLGVMPLPDNPYTRGKCSYKLLQYAAAGLPLVGSPVGTNESVLKSLGGIAATSTEEWVDAASAVIEMGSTSRLKLGNAMRDGVVKDFSFDRWNSTWAGALGIAREGTAQS